eukprot:TRINITY_DN12281_c1_g3_i1.p1 TRINITY_DN12281_c1_g3~~TRINITY_DN12281_c1_g3_i1.p1  ORF type:complete len:290 (+),score=57.21 TRINITY_DN12281_c1_g3_i1:75-944(+)
MHFGNNKQRQRDRDLLEEAKKALSGAPKQQGRAGRILERLAQLYWKIEAGILVYGNGLDQEIEAVVKQAQANPVYTEFVMLQRHHVAALQSAASDAPVTASSAVSSRSRTSASRTLAAKRSSSQLEVQDGLKALAGAPPSKKSAMHESNQEGDELSITSAKAEPMQPSMMAPIPTTGSIPSMSQPMSSLPVNMLAMLTAGMTPFGMPSAMGHTTNPMVANMMIMQHLQQQAMVSLMQNAMLAGAMQATSGNNGPGMALTPPFTCGASPVGIMQSPARTWSPDNSDNDEA